MLRVDFCLRGILSPFYPPSQSYPLYAVSYIRSHTMCYPTPFTKLLENLHNGIYTYKLVPNHHPLLPHFSSPMRITSRTRYTAAPQHTPPSQLPLIMPSLLHQIIESPQLTQRPRRRPLRKCIQRIPTPTPTTLRSQLSLKRRRAAHPNPKHRRSERGSSRRRRHHTRHVPRERRPPARRIQIRR